MNKGEYHEKKTTIKCPDCGKEFEFEYEYNREKELLKGARDKEIKELYIDCPNEECGETNKYTIEIT